MATILKADGTRLEGVRPAKGKKFTLQELQQAVGGLIERVRVGRYQHMYVNEEGLIHGLWLNDAASEMAKMHIVGDVIIPDVGEV